MRRIADSPRIRILENQWNAPIQELFRTWHWDENLKHAEIGKRVGLPRPTITRWFREFGIASQSCTRFTNLNLLNTGPRKGPRAQLKVKREFPWRVNQSFFTKWSEEMAYVLGFFVADGNLTINPRGSKYIEFTSCDKYILERIREAMGSNHRIGEKLRTIHTPSQKDCYRLQIGSKKLFEDLCSFGMIVKKSLVVRMPKSLPEKYLGHFVRGYFDGDGCIYFKKHKIKVRKNLKWILSLSFRSGSLHLLNDLKKRLARYTQGGFITGNREHSWELVYSHNDSRALFHLLYDQMKSNLYLTRKHTKYLEVMSWVVGR